MIVTMEKVKLEFIPRISISNNVSTSANTKWVRPLGYVETFMTNARNFGIMTTTYALRLDSKAPISIDLVRQAVSMLYKKFPHLRRE